MRRDLLGLVWDRADLADLDPPARRLALRSLLTRRVVAGDLPPTVAALADEIDGYGRLTPLMEDAAVTDILVNGPHEIWVEREGMLALTALAFDDEAELLHLIDRLVSDCGGRVDTSRAVGDVRLPDNSRMHVVFPPLAPFGPIVSIRRFPSRSLDIDDLVGRGMLTAGEASVLVDHVRSRRSLAIGGGTGSGKTTLLNALLAVVPDDECIVTVEETPELRPAHPHCVSLVTRPPNLEGAGTVTLDELVRAALRMRPDRIVVGEVRGPEALAALTAMSTGHAGSLVTVHASSLVGTWSRLVDLALESGRADRAALEHWLRGAVDVLVYLERVGPARRVAAIGRPG